ncbi:hypothetical protein GRI69_07595 [Erythrobacter vulgaris]|uniref:Uncharacterized protein n=1 Tax=Qipengyuania vulgaris TaxID=291985 RepID=A0A844XS92_9SPHN|nr:hypothetical protein [Qipengyuania vulgaris]MXO48117.1 hypothetical protein [Qipengyuania vulgaris]
MSDRLDYPALFKQATGRAMLPEDADQLRDFLLLAPEALAQSPTYVADLMVRYVQWRQLRDTVSDASDTILAQIQTRSEAVVQKMVDDTVERIHKASPSTQASFFSAFSWGSAVFTIGFAAALLLTFGLFTQGYVKPQWFTEESFAKINFAEGVEEAVGGDVDWHRREAPFDESLVEILNYANARGTNADPYHLLRLYESCQYPGQESYRSRGKLMCRYDAMSD